MNYDVDILREALDMATAKSQYYLAQMAYNDAVEVEANKTREMHELKPASWWEKTFNTDGHLRRREEAVRIQMDLTLAKQNIQLFGLWRTSLNDSKERYESGPYEKVIRKMRHMYPSITGSSEMQVRQQAVSGELDERNILLYAYSKRGQLKAFQQSQEQCLAKARDAQELSKQLAQLDSPSFFHRIFNTSANQRYKQTKNALTSAKNKALSGYQTANQQKEQQRPDALEYLSGEGEAVIARLEPKYPELREKNHAHEHEQEQKQTQTQDHAPPYSKASPATDYNHTGKYGDSRQQFARRWNLKDTEPSEKEKSQSQYQDHPYALKTAPRTSRD